MLRIDGRGYAGEWYPGTGEKIRVVLGNGADILRHDWALNRRNRRERHRDPWPYGRGKIWILPTCFIIQTPRHHGGQKLADDVPIEVKKAGQRSSPETKAPFRKK